MIHSPSSFTARMNEFRIWPSAFSVRNDSRVGAVCEPPRSAARSLIRNTWPHVITISGARANETAAFASTAIPPSNSSRAVAAGIAGARSAKPDAAPGRHANLATRPHFASPRRKTRSGVAGLSAPHSPMVAPRSPSKIAAPAAPSSAPSRTASRTKSCITVCCRNRTSVFDGCTFTSTSAAGISIKSSTTGNTVGGRILRYASVSAC